MQIACACASASIACSIVIAHSWCSMVLVMPLAKLGPAARSRAIACASASSDSGGTRRLNQPQRSPLAAQRAAGVQQFAGPALADDARQHRAGAHVAAGQAHAVEQERGLAACRAQAQVGRHRQDGAGAGTHAVDGRDDGLRAGTRMAFTRSPVMRVNISSSGAFSRTSGPMISCTSPPLQKLPPAPVITTALTSGGMAQPPNRSRSSA
jgi:hypothetical protein